MNTNLFQLGDFKLRSGRKSKWKIECDALTRADWDALAAMAAEILPPFLGAFGVPRGGVPFAESLLKYETSGEHPALIVEDVVTTGGSMEKFRKTFVDTRRRGFIGICVFARGESCPSWVTPLFALNPAFHVPRFTNPDFTSEDEV